MSGGRLDPARVDRARVALVRVLGDSKVITDPAILELHAGDASGEEPVLPDAVVRVERTEDIMAALAVASDLEIPVTPRGAGTGKSGGAIPISGGIVLTFAGMNRIDSIDRAEGIAVVEPGLVLGDLFAAVEAEGLFYPPDPNSWPSCTLGGNLAENASGPRSFKYGATRDYTLGLEVVTAEGRRLDLGRRTRKGVTGYDLTALMVGSEGTLAVMTRATLRLASLPPEVATLLALFDDVESACRAAGAVAPLGPRCLELLDGTCLAAMRAEGLDLPGGALLVVEIDGEAVKAGCERLGGQLAETARQVRIASDAGERERLWSVRRELSHITRRMAQHKISEDVVVPRAKLPALVREVERIAADSALTMLSYGHAGDGNLHVNVLWDDPDAGPRVAAALDRLFRAVLSMGGTLSGEHGIGTTKARYLPLEQSEPLIALQRDLKRVFDPKGILNPGKIFMPGHRAC